LAYLTRWSFSGSMIRSISVMRPPATVKPTTAKGLSSRPTTAPAAPLTIAGRACGANRVPRDMICRRAHDGRPSERGDLARVDPEDDVGVEHGQQPFEIARAGGSEKRVDDFALAPDIGVGLRPGASNPASPAAGQLPRRSG
jgi:hypothetical protein